VQGAASSACAMYRKRRTGLVPSLVAPIAHDAISLLVERGPIEADPVPIKGAETDLIALLERVRREMGPREGFCRPTAGAIPRADCRPRCRPGRFSWVGLLPSQTPNSANCGSRGDPAGATEMIGAG